MIRFVVIALFAVSAVAQEFENGIDQTGQLTKGLISYWSMRNSGTTVYDERGANNGTAQNGPVFNYTNGVSGNGLLYDGLNDGVLVAASASHGAANFSACAWIKPSTLSQGSYAGIVSRREEGDYAASNAKLSYVLYWRNIDSVISLTMLSTAGSFVALTYPKPNNLNWLFLVGTYDSSRIRLYENGSEVTNTASTVTIKTDASYEISIGGPTFSLDTTGSNGCFAGNIDEVRLYNRALTSDEIKQLYRMGATIYQNR